jgi:hypothetical protein
MDEAHMDEDERTADVAAWACIWAALADTSMPAIAPDDTAPVIAALAGISMTALTAALGGPGDPLRVLAFAERFLARLMLAELDAWTDA